MEIENAVNQANKELANRFDFKGSRAEIILEKNEIKLAAEDQFKINALTEIVMGRLAKRNISLKSVEKAEPDVSPLGHARQIIKIKQGIETTVAKQITGFIRDGKLKMTTQIQGMPCAYPARAATNCRPSSPPSAPVNFPWLSSLSISGTKTRLIQADVRDEFSMNPVFVAALVKPRRAAPRDKSANSHSRPRGFRVREQLQKATGHS